jgi:hypothetical protein
VSVPWNLAPNISFMPWLLVGSLSLSHCPPPSFKRSPWGQPRCAREAPRPLSRNGRCIVEALLCTHLPPSVQWGFLRTVETWHVLLDCRAKKRVLCGSEPARCLFPQVAHHHLQRNPDPTSICLMEKNALPEQINSLNSTRTNSRLNKLFKCAV